MSEKKSVFFYNTRTKQKEVFTPLNANEVSIYSCGPTVYSSPQIGNMRAYVFADTLRRTLVRAGYTTRHSINITDVGHLTSDGDFGEDKIEKQAGIENTTAQAITKKYTDEFFLYLDWLAIDRTHYIFPKATDYIKEQIALIRDIEKKGLTYKTTDGIYFDTSLFEGYGVLGGGASEEAQERIEVNKQKKNPSDFALWKFSKAGETREQEWSSDWGTGFPGWHIECSAMAKHLLGEEIDIHTGGIDHIPIHHNNEIAQSESVSGKPLARYWLHNAFLTLSGEKLSKSKGNTYTLTDLKQHGYHPLAFRYFCLLTHYKTPLAFSFDALSAAQNALHTLYKTATLCCIDTSPEAQSSSAVHEDTISQCESAFFDNLNTPKALGVMWTMMRDETIPLSTKQHTLYALEPLFGLALVPPTKPNPAVVEKIHLRNEKRKAKAWGEADAIREEIEAMGVYLEDSEEKTYTYTLPS